MNCCTNTAAPDERRGLLLKTAERLGTLLKNAEKNCWVSWGSELLFNGSDDGDPSAWAWRVHDNRYYHERDFFAITSKYSNHSGALRCNLLTVQHIVRGNVLTRSLLPRGVRC